MDDNHKLTNRGGIHQLQKSKREFDFFLSCALSGYEAIIRWKTVFFHCFFVPEALFLEKENSTPWILFVLNGIYSYKVEFTFTSDHYFLYGFTGISAACFMTKAALRFPDELPS